MACLPIWIPAPIRTCLLDAAPSGGNYQMNIPCARNFMDLRLSTRGRIGHNRG